MSLIEAGSEKCLSALTKKRREHIRSCQENRDKSHDIVAGLYSDPSHFIYELLQNADDAKASEIIFKLTHESLSITHNGEKLFDFEDVDSITTVGSSTKKDDVNAIGTFGAGFKSVFAITATPEIHSGDFHFKISDFIVPEEVTVVEVGGNTSTVLPFNHPKVAADNAYQTILDRLQNFEAESLLFLHNIKEIKWETEEIEGHYLVEIEDDKASLISQVSSEDSLSEYFLSKKDIDIDGVSLNIAVAYKLDNAGKIVPQYNAPLFVFFPTRERTGFNFLVHAPYKTTPSRETIPFNEQQNKVITKELSLLIAGSLVKLKNNGLLSVDVLSILPIDSKNSHPLYQSSFDAVKNILRKEELLPSARGDYSTIDDALLAREKALAELLSPDDCNQLFEKSFWLSAEITSDKTRVLKDYLMKELAIPEITMQKFCSDMSESFFVKKDDQWIIQFYASITKNHALYRKGSGQSKGILRSRPIIRLENGSHVCPEDETGDFHVYMPPKGETKFQTVKRAIANNQEARGFLEDLGLKEPDNIAEVKEFIAPKYQGNVVDKSEYQEDFERVLAIWEQADKYKRNEIGDILRNIKFIRCKNQKGSNCYQLPKQVYFETEQLRNWFKNNSDDGIYFIDLPFPLDESSRKLLESLGVSYELIMKGITDINISEYGLYKRSANGFNPNFDIHGLKFALENMTIERSVLLWKVLLKYPNKLKGCIEIRTNQKHPYKKGNEQESKVKSLIMKYHWLHGENQMVITKSIEQIMLDDLSSKYEKENEKVDSLIKSLGMKLDEVARFEEEHPDKRVITAEDYKLLEEMKAQKDNDEDKWEPEVAPDDVNPTEGEGSILVHASDDLGNQIGEDIKGAHSAKPEADKKPTEKLNHNKEIGEWGEKLAHKYLQKEFPDDEVKCLNEGNDVGKGYDFVVRRNNEDYAYYEVKAKINEAPQLFKISGTQWNWAKRLYENNLGDKYRILLISGAGTKDAKVKVIKNPVALWYEGSLYANPVEIEL